MVLLGDNLRIRAYTHELGIWGHASEEGYHGFERAFVTEVAASEIAKDTDFAPGADHLSSC
jgi:hypothetical protein